MTRIDAYLKFNGNCSEAMAFYKECFGGELFLQTVEDSPMAKQWPAEVQKQILHASLRNENIVLLGSDMSSGPIVQGNTIALSLTCSSLEELKTFFASLSAGGKILQPITEFFAGTIGNLSDKYGMGWMLYFPKS